MSAIRVRRLLHVELHYDVLAHVDLGRDAASLFDRTRAVRAAPAWARTLAQLLPAAPDRLRLQVLPLASQGLTEHLALLGATPTGAALARALEQRRPAFEASFADGAALAEARAASFLERYGPALSCARAALWGARPPVPLEIRDATALACPPFGTHGRATTHGGGRVVAVAIDAPGPQVFCQILHEETHAVTDPAVRAAFGKEPRDTRAGSPGFALHRALERECIAAGGRVVEQHLPELVPAYQAWRRRWE